MENDPLAEPPACTCRKRCPCAKCHGHKWVQVLPGYAIAQHPDPDIGLLAALDEDAVAKLWADLASQRAAAANSTYPCRACAPSLFFRWAGGHFGRNHDTSDCDECIELMGKRSARRQAKLTTTPPRRDTDG